MADLLLGRGADGAPTVLDSKALTTHGFVLGMTGSGKTGLCVDLIEELLRAKIPVIAVDSKGDLGTLLLGFAPQDPALAQWVPDAAKESERLTAASAALGLSREQLAAFRASYEPRLYTPGASIGLPLDLLGSLAPPGSDAPDAIAESADSVTRGLLGLLGVEADPLAREYLLLVQILTTFWAQKTTPSLIDLVRAVAQPPFTAVGALPLDDFFPPKDRQSLMVRLNGLLASPKFNAWRAGEPLDLSTLLFASDGRPRLSIYSVAHLSDDERLFAVAQLLERAQGWMRKQGGGAGALKAVILIDEIFGYFPPAPANPPTKAPLLGLLKQARAFGLSVVLATQNPIDLDYRGLANIGTWLVGRLQTEQDKARIRDALVSAAASTGVTPAQLDNLIAMLQPRKFLLHSISRAQPVVFSTRDTLTTLHGPFSADELRSLSAPMKTGAVAAPPTTAPAAASPLPIGLEPELGPLYEVDRGTALPYALLKFGVRYRWGTIVSEETVHELAFPLEGTTGVAELLEGAPLSVKGVPFQSDKPADVSLTAFPSWVAGTKLAKLQAAVRGRLPSKLETKLLLDPQTKLLSGPLETPEAFATRVAQKQGLSVAAQKVMQKLERKRADLAQLEKEVTARKAEKWLEVGAGVLGLFGGRRSSIAAASRAMTKQRTQGTAESRVEDLQLEVQQLETDVTALKEIDPKRFEEQVCVPKSADVQLLRLCYAFIVP